MGAIYGIIGDADSSEVTAMGERLLHRGPSRKEWSPGEGVHWGQRSAGDAEDASPFIVFDGMLDNTPEIAKLLGMDQAGRGAISHRALAWGVFQRFGVEGFGHLSGQFVLAIWDLARRRLILARDRWGARSLYYIRSRGRLLFASEYKALLAIADVPARPNLASIRYTMQTQHGNPRACFLAGVEVVPRGAWLALEGDRSESAPFWDIAIDIVQRSEAEHAAAVRSALLDALRRQMTPYRAIGLGLSGGLDSALVLAGMRQVAPERTVNTFTVGHGDGDPEIIGAREAAGHFRTEHHEIVVGPEVLPRVLPEALWYMEDPVGGEEMTYQFIAAREAAGHVDIIFSGHKSDVQFGGMPRHKLLKLGLMLPPFRGLLEEFFHFTQTRRLPHTPAGRLAVKLYFRGDLPEAVSVRGAEELPPPRPLPFDSDQPLNQKLRRDILEGSSKLGATFQLHAAHGLAWNSPFMDAVVMRTAFQVPDNLKIRGLRQKHILRRACEGLVPESILQRKKSLQRLRHDTDLSEVLDRLAAELLSPAAVAARGIFEPSEIERLRRRKPSGRYSKQQAGSLWRVLLTEIWARLYLDDRGRPPVTGESQGAGSRSFAAAVTPEP